uniref:Uncharacterized protein n=1 Tax=Nelumbo nucifera TaxID=4432 RepID=A0A822Y0T0_NELNU|nr:TPA_asm: hypothetical protein HUJ06_026320 [Nelumbo nucifera]
MKSRNKLAQLHHPLPVVKVATSFFFFLKSQVLSIKQYKVLGYTNSMRRWLQVCQHELEGNA